MTPKLAQIVAKRSFTKVSLAFGAMSAAPRGVPSSDPSIAHLSTPQAKSLRVLRMKIVAAHHADGLHGETEVSSDARGEVEQQHEDREADGAAAHRRRARDVGAQRHGDGDGPVVAHGARVAAQKHDAEPRAVEAPEPDKPGRRQHRAGDRRTSGRRGLGRGSHGVLSRADAGARTPDAGDASVQQTEDTRAGRGVERAILGPAR